MSNKESLSSNAWVKSVLAFSIGINLIATAFYIHTKKETEEIRQRAEEIRQQASREAKEIRQQANREAEEQDRANQTKIYLACLEHGGKDCKNPYEEKDKPQDTP